MMRLRLLSALMLLVTALLISATSLKSQTASNKQTAQAGVSQKYESQSEPIRVAPVNVIGSNLDYINPILTLLLVVVGFAYTRAAYRQLEAIKIQAEIANKSLDSQMHAERPHVTLGRFERNDFNEEKRPSIIYDFKNLGRTPAFLIEYSIRLRMIEGVIPETPDYNKPFKFPDGCIIGKDERSNTERRTLEHGILTKETIEAVRGGAAHLIFYGYVTYRNVFSYRSNNEPHEHRFCFVWKPEDNLFILGGPKAYNHYS